MIIENGKYDKFIAKKGYFAELAENLYKRLTTDDSHSIFISWQRRGGSSFLFDLIPSCTQFWCNR